MSIDKYDPEDEIAWLSELNKENEAEKYGIKAINLGELIKLQEKCETNFSIPLGFVIPSQGIEDKKIEQALKMLCKDFSSSHPIIIRSSAADEEPGKYKTLITIFDPEAGEKNLQNFLEKYKRVIDNKPKAVIVQHLAAKKPDNIYPEWVKDSYGSDLWGYEDRSFVAHSHSLLNEDHIQISVVQGLASGIVDETGNSIVIDAERETGDIKMVLYLPEENYHYRRLSFSLNRQNKLYFFDENSNKTNSCSAPELMHNQVFSGENDSYMNGAPRSPFHSDLMHSYFADKNKRGPTAEEDKQADWELKQVISVTRELAKLWGEPIEIEGNFVDSGFDKPGNLNIFQIRTLEPIQEEKMDFTPVSPQNLIAEPKFVFGSINFQGYLIHLKKNYSNTSIINAIINKYGKENCMILTESFYNGSFWGALEDLPVKISLYLENMQSHNLGYMRSRIAKGESVVYAAISPNQAKENPTFNLNQKPATESLHEPGISIYENVCIQSNGRRCQLFFKE